MLLASSVPIWESLPAASVGVLAFLAGIMRWVIRTVVRDENRKQEKKLKEQWTADLAPILREVSPNHGTSMKDKLDQTTHNVVELQTSFNDYKESNNQRVTRLENIQDSKVSVGVTVQPVQQT